MPPKAKITKGDIIGASFELVRSSGLDSLNVRAVSAKLHCSTQPIMYHYKTVDELKADVYAAADEFHTRFITDINESESPLLALGLNYVRFAAEEKNLFRLLFQSDKFRSGSFSSLFSGEETLPIQSVISEQTKLGAEQARELFEALFICAHGIASMLADNSLEYDRAYVERLLSGVFEAYYLYLERGKEE